jgi:hypothetical protein
MIPSFFLKSLIPNKHVERSFQVLTQSDFISDTLKQKGQILMSLAFRHRTGIARWSRYPGDLLKEAAWEAANL